MQAAPSEARENTRALVEAHIAEHDHHSLYLLAVPASVAPNVSLAADLVLEKQLERRCVGVFTMCDEVPKRKLDLLKKRLEAGAGKDSGVVRLTPHGWVATMLAPIESSEHNLKVLRLQAEAEDDWFKKNMADNFAEGNATTSALVDRLALIFHGYLQRDWGPRTLQVIDRQLESCKIQHASLGLPALRGQPDEARTRAIEESLKVLELNKGAMLQQCCHVVLGTLKTEIATAVEPVLRGILPEDFVGLWSGCRGEVEEACRMAKLRWVKFYADEAREALFRRPAVPFNHGQALEAAFRGWFVLARFPQFVDACITEFRSVLQQTADRALAVALKNVENFFEGPSPYVQSITHLHASPARMTVYAQADKLAEACVFAFLSVRSVAQAELEERLEKVAQSIEDWDENCAEERETILRRESELEQARETVRSMLGISALDLSTCPECDEPCSSSAGHFCSRRRIDAFPHDVTQEGGRFLKTMF